VSQQNFYTLPTKNGEEPLIFAPGFEKPHSESSFWMKCPPVSHSFFGSFPGEGAGDFTFLNF